MAMYVIKRFLGMVVTLLVIATITFFMIAAAPGDALEARAERLPEQTRINLYAKYGLDKPVMERYFITMKAMLRGDFGESILYSGQTVSSIAKEKGPITLRLGLQQLVLGLSIGLFMGVVSVVKKGTAVEYATLVIATLFISIPTLVLSLALQKIFAGTLHWFPVIGWPKGDDLWFGGWKYTVLPTVAGCLWYIATYSRILKSSMLDVISQDYILTARSKGLSERMITVKHVLRNASVPLVTELPRIIIIAITNTFFIERVFAIPGIGLYYINAVSGRDVTIIMGYTVIIAAIYNVSVFIADILYPVVDPRIRIRKEAT